MASSSNEVAWETESSISQPGTFPSPAPAGALGQHPRCRHTLSPRSPSAPTLGQSRWKGLSPKAVQGICGSGAASCAGLDLSPLHSFSTQGCRGGTVCHFRCFIHRFHQHLILVLWILVTSQCWPIVHVDVVKSARASLTTFMKIQMTALPKWLWG